MKNNNPSLLKKLRRWAEKGDALSIEKSSFKKLFWVLFTPFIVFITIDMITTYIGVCVLGQIELNPTALIIGKFGYIFVCIFQYGRFVVVALVFAFFLKRSSRNDIRKFFILFLWSFLLYNYVQTILFNSNMLYASQSGEFVVEPYKLDPESDNPQEYWQSVQQANISFEPIRNDFCRVLP